MKKLTEILSVYNLRLALEQHHTTLYAIDDVSFVLMRGETVALLGESGCGKSMTALALMRLLPNEARYGVLSQVWFNSEDLLQLPEKLMRSLRGKRLAIIFQEPMTALNPVLSIGNQLAEVIQNKKPLSRIALRDAMVKLLEEVEISEPLHRLTQYPHQLSGGQRQRIVIAMALASKPDVLIADEPTTALDVTTQSQILSLLKRLQSRYQMSILLITHDMSVVSKMADRVCVMYAGQLVESAQVGVFIAGPKHPYAQQLFVSLPSFEKRKIRLQAIPRVADFIPDVPMHSNVVRR
jgi:ABC-type dipeptide/oligopeptide/nickel transport system ATPase component